MCFSATPMSLPLPPYYAAIFTSQLSEDTEDYAPVAEAMVALARQQPGFLGVESVRDASGRGITISYWESPEAIRAWKAQTDHVVVQATGRARWYADYTVQIARVERAYSGPPTATT